MITILVVSPEDPELDGLEGKNPSVEVLRARDLEETLDKLGRNRRIDAVLLYGREETAGIAAAVLEDNPAAPPLFAPTGREAGARVRGLVGGSPAELLVLIERELSG